MGPLDPDIVGAILGIPGAVLALALSVSSSRKKSWRWEAAIRSWDR